MSEHPPGAYAPIVEVPGRPVVVAHAGASGDAPANTMVAFELAIDQGARLVEVDAHITTDGHLVVHHDDTFARATDADTRFPEAAPWRVRDLTFDQIRQLSTGEYRGAPVRVPSLREVLDLVRRRDAGVLVETKAEHAGPGLEPAIAELMRGYPDWQTWVPARVMVGSFFVESLRRMRRELPGVNLACIVVSMVARRGLVTSVQPATAGVVEAGMTLEQVRDRLAGEGIGYLGLAVFGVNGRQENDFTADTVALFREGGVEVNLVTDDPEVMWSFAERGVTSILTGHPARLVAVLDHLDP